MTSELKITAQESGLAGLASQINDRHQLALNCANAAVDHARQAGEALIEAKGRVARGKWLTWLQDHTDISPRAAQKYMRLADRWSEIEANTNCDSHLTIDGALKLLTVTEDEDGREQANTNRNSYLDNDAGPPESDFYTRHRIDGMFRVQLETLADVISLRNRVLQPLEQILELTGADDISEIVSKTEALDPNSIHDRVILDAITGLYDQLFQEMAELERLSIDGPIPAPGKRLAGIHHATGTTISISPSKDEAFWFVTCTTEKNSYSKNERWHESSSTE